MEQQQSIKRIHSLHFRESPMVQVNNFFDVNFEDLADPIAENRLMDAAIVTVENSPIAYKRFLRRVNYLLYNNGNQYLEHDTLMEKGLKYTVKVYRVNSYKVKK